MSREQIDIRTKAGTCPSWVFRPEAAGKLPAVIFYIDRKSTRLNSSH